MSNSAERYVRERCREDPSWMRKAIDALIKLEEEKLVKLYKKDELFVKYLEIRGMTPDKINVYNIKRIGKLDNEYQGLEQYLPTIGQEMQDYLNSPPDERQTIDKRFQTYQCLQKSRKVDIVHPHPDIARAVAEMKKGNKILTVDAQPRRP